MHDTWFEQDLKNWTKLSDNYPAYHKAALILNIAKIRLEKNDGHDVASSGGGSLRILENKLNKLYERKKLGYVIRILECFVATGNFEFYPSDRILNERQREEYEHLVTIIKERLLSPTAVKNKNTM